MTETISFVPDSEQDDWSDDLLAELAREFAIPSVEELEQFPAPEKPAQKLGMEEMADALRQLRQRPVRKK